jgi:hypothetical protein
MTRFNARLNDLQCDVREGDLAAPVAEHRFDWVVSQPPFVASPDDRPTTFLHGGRRGDELLLRLLGQIPPLLRARGRALVLADLPEVGEPWARRIVQHLGTQNRLGVVVSFGGMVDADMLAIQLGAFAAPSMGHFGERIVAYRAHLDAVGVSRTFHALIDIRTSAVPFAAERRWDRFSALSSKDFESAWDAAALASQSDDILLASMLRLPTGARILAERDPGSEHVRIRLEAAAVRHELSEGAAAIVEAVIASPKVSDGLIEVLPPDAASAMVPDVCRLLRSLLVSGALVPVPGSGSS